MLMRSCAAATLTALLLIGSPALADDPPLRVGRISYLDGSVSFHSADEDSWSNAPLNYPVVAGNTFWTEPDGRSEVQLGSVEVRMDHSTQMVVSQLDENNTQLQVPQGIVNIHFSTPPVNGSVEVLTPAGPIELTHPGTYHIDSGQPAPTTTPYVQVTALEGQLEIPGPHSLLDVMTGETATLSGNPPTFALQEGNPTAFDNWALARERREEARYATQYVSPYMTGYEDLDTNGEWAADPSYGNVWYPTVVQADWAPYRYGHWAYVAPWGWTWVDNAPWGFAPFHYGRWAYVGNRWGWVPGEAVARPVYAPALVAFVGGSGWNVSLAIGGATPAVGWVPLGPHEVFHPYYATSLGYARNINMSNVSRMEINNITTSNIHNVTVNNYANARAATVVPANAFRQGQPVHQAQVKVSPEQFAHAPVAPSLEHLPSANIARAEDHSPSPASAPAHTTVMPLVPHQQSPSQAMYADHEAHVVKMDNRSSAALGPQISHSPLPQNHYSAAKNEPLPKAQVPHPQQQTHIAPTPQGWQRVPQHEQKEAQHAHSEEKHDNDKETHDR